MRARLSALFVLLLPGCLFAITELSPLYEKAQEAFDRSDYAQAARHYERIRLGGHAHHPEVHFNLGNCYFRQGLYGAALQSFHRAQWLAPIDGDIRMNLRMAAEQLRAHPPVVPWYRIPSSILSQLRWQQLTILLISGLCLYGLSLKFGSQRLRLSAVWVVPVSLLLITVSLFASWASSDARFLDRALILERGAEARFEPSANATANFALKAGTEIFIERRQGDWLQILHEGNRAWLPETSVGPLDWR